MIASAAMLKTVRYSGYGCLTLNVHCVQTPATATSTAARGPSSSSAIRSAAYDTDSVEPLASGIGRLTFHDRGQAGREQQEREEARDRESSAEDRPRARQRRRR